MSKLTSQDTNPLGPVLLALVYLVSSALVLWCILRCLLHIIVHF
jgi:hypothetical protein